MKIRKRDGRIVAFDDSKITDAIFAAAQAVGGADREMAVEITLCVLKCLKAENQEVVDVEHVQDIVEKVLIKKGHAKTAKSYILYRAKRTDIRNARSELMDTVAEILKETDRDNANISNSPSAKMLQIASAASREYYLNRVIPEEMAAAHKRGDIHIHDLDFYGKTLNCLNIPLGRLLHEGFNNGHGYYSTKRFFRRIFERAKEIGVPYIRVSGATLSEGSWHYQSVWNVGGGRNLYDVDTREWGSATS